MQAVSFLSLLPGDVSCYKNTPTAKFSLACLEIRLRNEEAINSTRNRIYSLKGFYFPLYRHWYFLFVSALILYMFEQWPEIRLRSQALHEYKYSKIQGPRFQRNYIIVIDQESDLHGTSFQSSPKVNRMLITRPFSYNHGFLQQGLLQPGVLTTIGSYNQGVLTTGGSYSQGSYNQEFLRPGVLTTRGSYNQGFLQPGVFQPGVLQPGFLATRGLTTRVSYNQGSYIRGSFNQGSYNQGFLQPGILTTGGSYNQWS